MISLTLLKELKPFDCAATALRPVQRRRKTGPAEPDVTRAITGLLAGLWSAAQPHAAQGSPPRPFSPPKGHPCVQSKQLCNIYRFLIDIATCAFTNGRPVRVAVAQRAAAESVLRGSTAAQGRDPDVQRSAIRSLPSPRLAPLGRPSRRARAVCCVPSAGKGANLAVTGHSPKRLQRQDAVCCLPGTSKAAPCLRPLPWPSLARRGAEGGAVCGAEADSRGREAIEGLSLRRSRPPNSGPSQRSRSVPAGSRPGQDDEGLLARRLRAKAVRRDRHRLCPETVTTGEEAASPG